MSKKIKNRKAKELKAMEIYQIAPFKKWLSQLSPDVQVRLIKRIEKVEQGNLGDYKPIRKGIYEMRENYDGGYRIYYMKFKNVVVMLRGGDKSSQKRDVKRAIEFSKSEEIEELRVNTIGKKKRKK